MAFEIKTVYRAPTLPESKSKYIYEYHFQDWDRLILEPEDYTEDEWKTILKIFSMEEAERIVISNYRFEAFGRKKA
jgi:hypothetical protein